MTPSSNEGSMTQPSPSHPPVEKDLQGSLLEGEEPQLPAVEGEAEAVEPYEDLWDPNTDTRPERIRRTKKPRLVPRARGRRREAS
jgi:hypothetical protein